MPRILGRLNINFSVLPKQFGFSETYGIVATDYVAAATVLTQIIVLRLGLLPYETEIVGGLISDTDVKGDSYPVPGVFPAHGTWSTVGTDACEQPYLALRNKFFGGVLKRSSRFLHSIPASQIAAGGVYTPTAPWTTALTAYLSYVQAQCSVMSRIPGAVAPPFYVFTPYTSYTEFGLEKRNIGRPFGLPVGRRLVA